MISCSSRSILYGTMSLRSCLSRGAYRTWPHCYLREAGSHGTRLEVSLTRPTTPSSLVSCQLLSLLVHIHVCSQHIFRVARLRQKQRVFSTHLISSVVWRSGATTLFV